MAIAKQYINAKSRTVTSSSASFTAALKPRTKYLLVGDVDFWCKLDDDAATVAASADGALFRAGGAELEFATGDGGGQYLHVIRGAAVDGNVNLAEVVEVEV